MTQADINKLKKEYQQAIENRSNNFADFCWHRACFWEYHAFTIIIKSYRNIAATGILPTVEFIRRYKLLQKKLLQRSQTLPEYEQYSDSCTELKELKLVLLSALREVDNVVKGGGNKLN